MNSIFFAEIGLLRLYVRLYNKHKSTLLAIFWFLSKIALLIASFILAITIQKPNTDLSYVDLYRVFDQNTVYRVLGFSCCRITKAFIENYFEHSVMMKVEG